MKQLHVYIEVVDDEGNRLASGSCAVNDEGAKVTLGDIAQAAKVAVIISESVDRLVEQQAWKTTRTVEVG